MFLRRKRHNSALFDDSTEVEDRTIGEIEHRKDERLVETKRDRVRVFAIDIRRLDAVVIQRQATELYERTEFGIGSDVVEPRRVLREKVETHRGRVF